MQTHHPQSSSDFFKDLQSAVRNFQEALDRLSQNVVLRNCKLGFASKQPKRTTAFIKFVFMTASGIENREETVANDASDDDCQ